MTEEEKRRKAEKWTMVNFCICIPLCMLLFFTDHMGLAAIVFIVMACVNGYFNGGNGDGASSGTSSWFTPPKNPRYLRRKIRHGLGW